MTDHTVVGDRVALDVGFRAGRTRLRILAQGGMLLRASEVAYGEGITVLVSRWTGCWPDPAGRRLPGGPDRNR